MCTDGGVGEGQTQPCCSRAGFGLVIWHCCFTAVTKAALWRTAWLLVSMAAGGGGGGAKGNQCGGRVYYTGDTHEGAGRDAGSGFSILRKSQIHWVRIYLTLKNKDMSIHLQRDVCFYSRHCISVKDYIDIFIPSAWQSGIWYIRPFAATWIRHYSLN